MTKLMVFSLPRCSEQLHLRSVEDGAKGALEAPVLFDAEQSAEIPFMA
jgi:hypothetical protein